MLRYEPLNKSKFGVGKIYKVFKDEPKPTGIALSLGAIRFPSFDPSGAHKRSKLWVSRVVSLAKPELLRVKVVVYHPRRWGR